jgi:hypothetical protein
MSAFVWTMSIKHVSLQHLLIDNCIPILLICPTSDLLSSRMENVTPTLHGIYLATAFNWQQSVEIVVFLWLYSWSINFR